MTTRRRLGLASRPPATLRSAREQRELMVSFSIVAVLQVAIAAALIVCAHQTYRMWQQGIAYIPENIARVVPASLVAGALIALFAASRSVRRVRSIQRATIESPPEE
jgi:uncharacterized protein (DUF983 family)